MPFFANPKTREVKEIKPGSPASDLELFSVRLPAQTLEQAQVYAGAANAFEFGLPKTPSQEASQISVPSTITSDDLTPRAPFTPSTIKAPPPPTITFEETPKEKELVGMEGGLKDLYAQFAEKPQFEQLQREQAGIEAKTQVFESLSRQIRDIAKQQEAVPLTIEKQSVGRGRTEGGVFPLQIGLRRTLAYEGLILASRLDAARGDLEIAERKVKTAVDTKFAPIEAQIARDEKNYNLIKSSPTTTRQEKQRALELQQKLDARKAGVDKAKKENEAILDTVNKASIELSKRGELNDATKEDLSRAAKSETLFEALDILSPYLKETDRGALEVAVKVSEQGGKAEQIEYIRKSRDEAEAARRAIEMGFIVTKPVAATGDIAEFKSFFPNVDITTPAGRQQYLNWSARLKEAGREPKKGGAPSEVVSYYAEQVRSGALDLINVPAETRDAVAGELSKGISPKTFTDEELKTAATSSKEVEKKTYEQTIADIEANPIIVNKDQAKKVAADVYGKKVETPVFGKGNFAEISIAERARELNDLQLSSVQIRTQLVKDGYPKNEATSEANKYGGVLDKFTNTISNYLFGE